MEYLAADRPVVATDTPAAEQFRDLLHIADAPDGWVRAIRDILGGTAIAPRAARGPLAGCTWNRQVDRIWSAPGRVGGLR